MGLYQKVSLRFKEARTKKVLCKVYNKCADMPLYNFEKYLETNDKKWFTDEYELIDSYRKKAINVIVEIDSDLDRSIAEFYNDMFEITKDSKVLDRYHKIHKMMCLEGKYNTVTALLGIFYAMDERLPAEIMEEAVSELEKWNYKLDRDKPLFEQLEKIRTRIQGIKTRIELIEAELQDDNSDQKADITKEILNISRCLELNYKIDSKNTTVKEYLLLKIDANKKIEHEQRNR